MGLDMYLTARRSVGFRDPDPLKTQLKAINLDTHHGMDVEAIEYEAMYWRKANHIHNFFVKNCQDGVDDCRRSWVSDSVLVDLVARCDAILSEDDPYERDQKAIELLPTQEGFFFGGTDLGEYYYDEVKRTRAEVAALLQMAEDAPEENWSFYYQSSW